MPAKELKLKPDERRRAPRVALHHKPKGVLQLSAKYRTIDILQIRDVSPFGFCLLLKHPVGKDVPVRLQYLYKGIQIGVTGTVVWRNFTKLPGTSSATSFGCWVGIFLHPSDIDANFALYQALMEGAESRGSNKTKRPA